MSQPSSSPGGQNVFNTLLGRVTRRTDALYAFWWRKGPRVLWRKTQAGIDNGFGALVKNGRMMFGLGPERAGPATKINMAHYRSPIDLERSTTPINRVLYFGACINEEFPAFVKASRTPCDVDFVYVNNIVFLGEHPPRPVGEYDFQIIQIPLRGLMPEHFSRLQDADIAGHELLLTQTIERFSHFLSNLMKWNLESGLLTFVTNFPLPQQNPSGKLFPRYDIRNIVHFMERLNQAVCMEIGNYKNAFLLDVDQISANHGRRFFQDDALYMSNHANEAIDFDFDRDLHRIQRPTKASEFYGFSRDEFIDAIWSEAVAMYRTMRQTDFVKLVVVDLDDTLWRGVVAETGAISTDTIEGWPLGMIEALLFLKRRGVLLAVCSKNEEQRIVDLWKSVWGERIYLDDFAVRKINWRSKVDNIREIFAETNLLPRNVLFIDDNPVERASVEAAYPGIRTLGAEPYLIRRILLWSPETQTATVTAESARRTEMIQAQIERETNRKQMSREEFLASLDIDTQIYAVRSIEDGRFLRAFELINKTNQFNTTGRRWSVPECVAAFVEGAVFHVFEVKDRFSAYGLVGVVIVADGGIEQVVMSCRVLGLDVELNVIAEVCRGLQRAGIREIRARLVETDVNFPCRPLFERCGFEKTSDIWIKQTSPETV